MKLRVLLCALLFLDGAGASHNQSDRNLRYAVCLTGEARGYDEYLAQNFATNVLEVLPRASVVDVFVVFSIIDAFGAADATSSIYTALHRLQPVHLSFFFHENSTKTVIPNCSNSNSTDGIQHAGREKMASQWDKIEHCLGVIAQKEISFGQSYDFVVRCRPDLFYFHPVSTWFRTSLIDVVQVGETIEAGSCSRYTVANDHFAIIPRHLTRVYASAAASIRDCTSASEIVSTSCHDCTAAHAECYLSFHLISSNTPFHGFRRSYSRSATGHFTILSLWTVARKVNGTWFDRFKKWRLADLERLPRLKSWDENDSRMLSREFGDGERFRPPPPPQASFTQSTASRRLRRR
jgi:hypothetical protein